MPPKRKADALTTDSAGNDEGESDSAPLAPPPITPDVLQFRITTGNMGKFGGQRGSLTRCAQKLGALQQAQQRSDDDETTTTSVATAKQDLAKELQLFELEMTKLIMQQQQRDRQVQLNAKALEQQEAEITELQEKVSESAKRARHVMSQRNAMAEYEALAKLILEQHPATQDQLKQQIADVEKQSLQLDAQLKTVAETKKVRTAQFSLLIQYMNDLKRSLKEDENDKDKKPKAKSDKDDAMDVDDGDLYVDLSSAKRKQG